MNQNASNKVQKFKQVSVEVKCVFVKICQIDTVNEHYYADIFIQAKWREPNLDNKSEMKNITLSKLWNPKLYVENIYGEHKESSLFDVIYPDNKRSAYIVERRRIKGVFHETLELKQFPFDCQDLSVSISTELSSDEIELVESTTDISKLNISSVLDSQEWNLHSHVDVSIRQILSDCDIGPRRRQLVIFTCRASRRFGYFMINHIMISAMLSFLAFCSFAVTPSNTHGRLQLCMIILLTTVTFKVVVSQNLPKISYLTYLDKAVLGNIFAIMCLCLWHAATAVFFDGIYLDIANSKKEALMVENIKKIEKILIPCSLGLYVFAIIVFGLIIYFDAGSRRRKMCRKDAYFEAKLNRLSMNGFIFDT